MDKNTVKKYLYRNKELTAKFLRYTYGNLYYSVQLEDGVYQFPISTIDDVDGKLFLSSDLGTTDFDSEIKASFLNRWIDKSIEKGEFTKL